MGVLKRSTPRKSETKIIPDNKDGTLPYVEKCADECCGDACVCEEDGQLSVDVFQTAEYIVIVAPVAGVKPDDFSINVTDDVLTIKGKRDLKFAVDASDYFTQECFWGNFSRSVILPEAVDVSRVNASFNNGVLTVRIPKIEKIRTRTIKIKEE
ncbi:Hsp20/alpha crystallin family protein [Candidatus Peregrinibacteria bacterium]|nr:Hsp20/alpha crystallin family protein [Candidatus Peregrinibacteria bacterium]